MKTMNPAAFFILLSSCACVQGTILAGTGYIAASSPFRDFLLSSGLAGALHRSSESLYSVSGFKYAGDQGTGIRVASMKDYDIVESGTEKPYLQRRISEPENQTMSQTEDRMYNERLFGVLKQMNTNNCITRLFCEIGADPTSYGVIGHKIHHYLKSVPPVTWNSNTFPFKQAFRAGLRKGESVCKEHYFICTYDLRRVIELLWFTRHLHVLDILNDSRFNVNERTNLL